MQGIITHRRRELLIWGGGGSQRDKFLDFTQPFKLRFKLKTDVTHIGIYSLVCHIPQLIVVCPVLPLFVTAVKGIIKTFREQNKPGCLQGENSDHFYCLRRPLLFIFVIIDSLLGVCVCVLYPRNKRGCPE